MMQQLESKVAAKKSNKAACAKVVKYEEWCAETKQVSYPMTYSTVLGFLCKHVMDNNGSTKSVKNVKSFLKKACESRKEAWLSTTEQNLLNEVMRELQILDMSEGRQKKALQIKSIIEIIEKADLNSTIELYVCLLLITGHKGLLRSGELLSGLKRENILWNVDKKGFRLFLKWTKTGGSAWIDYSDFEGINAVQLLRLWFDKNDLWSKSEANIFPAVSSTGKLNFEKTASTSWLRSRIKKAVKSIGLDPAKFSGHSLRAGGATDLFVARTPYYIIKKKGRWLSDAAMRYYRDEADVEAAVNKAFAACSSAVK